MLVAGTRKRAQPAPPHFAPDGHGGSDLRWTLLVEEPLPDASRLGHLRKRINQLINADLRYSYGQ